ncbi:MAG: hypothetical protein ACKVPX_11975 [Myxococcaceae bacterium]
MDTRQASASASGSRTASGDGAGGNLLANKWLLAGLAGAAAGFIFGGRSTKAAIWGAVAGLVTKLVSPTVYAAFTAARAGAAGNGAKPRPRTSDGPVVRTTPPPHHETLAQRLEAALPGLRLAGQLQDVARLQEIISYPDNIPRDELELDIEALGQYCKDLPVATAGTNDELQRELEHFLDGVKGAIADGKEALRAGATKDDRRPEKFAARSWRLRADQFDGIVDRVRPDLKGRLWPTGAVLHTVKRYMEIGRQDAATEGLLTRLESLLGKVAAQPNNPSEIGVFFEQLLAAHLTLWGEAKNEKLTEAMHLLQQPFVKAYLENEGWSFPQTAVYPATINDVIRSHPETRSLCNTTTPEGSEPESSKVYAGLRVAMLELEANPYFDRLCRLGLCVRIPDPPSNSFPDALRAARQLACNKQTLQDITLKMREEEPSADAAGVYKMMELEELEAYRTHAYNRLRADLGRNPDIVRAKFYKAGLGKLYDAHFKNAQEFWRSGLSLQEILDLPEPAPEPPPVAAA